MHLLPPAHRYNFLLFGRSRSPTRNRTFDVFAESFGPRKYVFLPIPFPSTIHVFIRFNLGPFIRFNFGPYREPLPYFYPFSYFRSFSADIVSPWFPPKSFHIFSTTISHLIPLFQVALFLLSPIQFYQLWLATSFFGMSLTLHCQFKFLISPVVLSGTLPVLLLILYYYCL